MSRRTAPSFASTPQIRARMQRVRRRDTAEELRIRSMLHERGLRYRVDARPIPTFRRRADIVFRSVRLAVFVDGCFWHGCLDHGSRPRTNASWWKTKLGRNVERDRETDRRLAEAGWQVHRVWAHEDPAAATAQVVRAVGRRRKDAAVR